MNESKFELTDMTLEVFGVVLHRIRSLKDFVLPHGVAVKRGDLGGFVEREENLSHAGSCWIGGNSFVYGGASVCEDAVVCGSATVSGDVRVSGSAWVGGSAWVTDGARLSKKEHLLCIGPIGSESRNVTFFRGEDKILVRCGCFASDVDNFRAKVVETHGSGKHGVTYALAADLAEAQIDLS